MAYTYSSLITALATELATDPTNVSFLAILPTIIDDSEQLCYRELDLLTAVVTVNGTATANSRSFTLPTSSGHILVVDSINTIGSDGIRYPIAPSTREGIDFIYPTDTAPTSPCHPRDFARVNDTTLLLGPAPDSGYVVEISCTIRPTALSASNTSTYLSNYLSDLFFAGCMVSASGYLRNFGSQSDDPRMAVSWKGEFAERLASARTEELRKSYVSAMSSGPTSKKDA